MPRDSRPKHAVETFRGGPQRARRYAVANQPSPLPQPAFVSNLREPVGCRADEGRRERRHALIKRRDLADERTKQCRDRREWGGLVGAEPDGRPLEDERGGVSRMVGELADRMTDTEASDIYYWSLFPNIQLYGGFVGRIDRFRPFGDDHEKSILEIIFTKPAEGQPALISWDDATTMFHEFGHALHGMFSDVKYPTLSGTNVPRDFVEFPSQFNEHWANDPKVFANFARHYQTGEPMPAALVEKIRKTRTYGQGFATTEYLAAALLDMAWHVLPADAPKQDMLAFEKEALAKYKVAMADVPPRYRTTYFAHVWGGGYAAGYYAYLWSEVLDHDTYYWFR